MTQFVIVNTLILDELGQFKFVFRGDFINSLFSSLLNLGLGTFVPTGTTNASSEGIEHDMCGTHPFNGLVYGGARALTHPFDFAEAVRNSV